MPNASAPKKRFRLRAIDAGTRYDIAGNLKRLARAIERGEYGDVRDCVIGVRAVTLGGGATTASLHLGTGSIPGVMYTLESMKKGLLP